MTSIPINATSSSSHVDSSTIDRPIEIKSPSFAQKISILYAANYLDIAYHLLESAVNGKNSHEKELWLMLFNLCHLKGLQSAFARLATQYGLQFKEPPPTWKINSPSLLEQRKEKRNVSDFYSFNRVNEESILEDIKKAYEFATQNGAIRIDIGKLSTLQIEEAVQFSASLIRLREKKITVRFNGIEQMVSLLEGIIKKSNSKKNYPYWLLLFELYQYQGSQSAFEALALEYVISFGKAAPIWISNQTSTPAHEADSETFKINGILSHDNRQQLQRLINFSANRNEIHIHLYSLLRIEFSLASIFIDVLYTLHQEKKKIFLYDVNHMTIPLLECLHVNKIATLLSTHS